MLQDWRMPRLALYDMVHETMTMTIIMILIILITINAMMTLKIWTMITILMTRGLSSSRIITKIIVMDKNITMTMS